MPRLDCTTPLTPNRLLELILAHSTTVDVNLPRFFVQIGAGAGDLDPRAKYRDGFSELLKSIPLQAHDKIMLVEPNPKNLNKLKECWRLYGGAHFFQVGIVPRKLVGTPLPFYFAEEDGPHYQVASFDAAHVLKHYPNLSIDKLATCDVSTIDLRTFLESSCVNGAINLLSLDIEGIDAEILLDTNFSGLHISLISIEHLHLGAKARQVINHMETFGFTYVGSGVDHNGYDWLFANTNRIV